MLHHTLASAFLAGHVSSYCHDIQCSVEAEIYFALWRLQKLQTVFTAPCVFFLRMPLAQTLCSGQQYCEYCLLAYRPAASPCLVRVACSTCPRGLTWSPAASGTSCSIPNLLALSGKKLPRPPKPSELPCISALCCHIFAHAAALGASLTQHCSLSTVCCYLWCGSTQSMALETICQVVCHRRNRLPLHCKAFGQGICGSYMV